MENKEKLQDLHTRLLAIDSNIYCNHIEFNMSPKIYQLELIREDLQDCIKILEKELK